MGFVSRLLSGGDVKNQASAGSVAGGVKEYPEFMLGVPCAEGTLKIFASANEVKQAPQCVEMPSYRVVFETERGEIKTVGYVYGNQFMKRKTADAVNKEHRDFIKSIETQVTDILMPLDRIIGEDMPKNVACFMEQHAKQVFDKWQQPSMSQERKGWQVRHAAREAEASAPLSPFSLPPL